MLTGPLPKLVDHRKLAEAKAELDFAMPVASFSRLSELLASDRGEIHARLKFRKGRKQRTLVLGECSGELEVICQTCLETMRVPVATKVRTLLVNDLDELMALDQSEDGLVCETEQVSLTDILEDELIVSLPMVPRHAQGECVLAEPVAEPEAETYKPFAGLAKLTEQFKGS